MFTQLRRKLALAYALLAGLVLAVIALSCLRSSEAQLRVAADTAFASGVDALVYKLQSDRTLSGSYLAQSEASSRQVIHIEDGGNPLTFRGSWMPKTDRSILVEMANEQALALNLAIPLGSLAPARVSFSLTGAYGEDYLASAALLPVSGGQPIKLVVIKDMSDLNEQIKSQRTTVLALGLGGLLALAAIGWVYSGRAVRPALENHRRQMEFTAVASHELKAPLAVISASAQALEEGFKPILLTNVESECARMARLVDDMLLLSRSDAGGWMPGMKRVDLDTLLIECYEMFQPLYKAKGIGFVLELPESSLSEVRGDADRIKQVLSVLLHNALGYAGGRVVLRAQAGSRWARLTVADDGPGVPDELKKRVFERFFRADAAHTDRTHYGLGLSVAKELARLHGGRLWVEDNAPRGAAFIFLLPLEKKKAGPAK